MKKTLCLILCLVMCVGLFAACGGKTEPAASGSSGSSASSGSSGAATSPTADTIGKTNTAGSSTAEHEATPPPKEAEYYDELSLYINDKVAIVDPLDPGARTAQSGILGLLGYDTLVRFELDGSYSPELATEWECNEDGSVWTFKLRDDVTFHNGEHFTADDVLFSAERYKETPGTYGNSAFKQAASIDVLGDYEIRFNLEKPNFDFVYDVCSPVVSIVNREAYESGDEHAGWIGTGAFKIVDQVPNDSITFEAYDGYWGEPVYCKKFTCRYIAERTARNIMLENDEFTFANVDGVDIPTYENDPRLTLTSYVMNNLNYVSFNMKKPVTGDKNFRLAVAYALDKQEIIDIALNGYGAPAETGALWGYRTAYKDYSIPPFERDLEKAKDYLAKSCYAAEGSPTLSITASMPHTIASAQVVQAALQAIGVNCEVKQLDAPTMTATTTWANNQEDIICGSGSWSPLGSSIKGFVTPGNDSNKALYENQEVVDLIDQAAATKDGPEREEMYHKIQQIMYEDLPYYGTFHMALYIGSQKGSGGAKYFVTNYHDYSHAYRLKNPD